MSPTLKTVLAIAIVLTSVELGASLKCYSCAGYLDQDLACEIDVTNEATIECNGDKICLEFILKEPSGSLLTRSCDFQDACTTLENKYESLVTQNLTKCRTCDSELCNSSAMTISSIFILVTILAAGIYWV